MLAAAGPIDAPRPAPPPPPPPPPPATRSPQPGASMGCPRKCTQLAAGPVGSLKLLRKDPLSSELGSQPELGWISTEDSDDLGTPSGELPFAQPSADALGAGGGQAEGGRGWGEGGEGRKGVGHLSPWGRAGRGRLLPASTLCLLAGPATRSY